MRLKDCIDNIYQEKTMTYIALVQSQVMTKKYDDVFKDEYKSSRN